MWIFYVCTIISLIASVFLIDYYVFFWGNYIFYLVAGLSFLILAINSIKDNTMILYKRRQRNGNPINDSINKRYRNKSKQENKKSLKSTITVLICSIVILGLCTISFLQIYNLSFDLPNVINNNYVKKSVKIIKSVQASSKGDHHTQYITALDVDTNDIIEIKFSHKYETILEGKYYEIWYLPHTHLGYKAYVINSS